MSEPFSNKNPFKVPEGYFEGLQEQVRKRIRDEEVPVRKLRSPHRRQNRSLSIRVGIAAAIVAMALVSYPLIRILSTGHDIEDEITDLVILDQTGVFGDAYHLAEYLDTDEEPPDEEEAYVEEAIEYLALNDVELDLILESY